MVAKTLCFMVEYIFQHKWQIITKHTYKVHYNNRRIYLLAGPALALAPWADAVDPDLLDAFYVLTLDLVPFIINLFKLLIII